MLELEQEIFDPSGISTIDPPKMILSGVLISQPCGILYHIDESVGLRYVVPLGQCSGIPDKASVRGATVVMSLPVSHSSQHAALVLIKDCRRRVVFCHLSRNVVLSQSPDNRKPDTCKYISALEVDLLHAGIDRCPHFHYRVYLHTRGCIFRRSHCLNTAYQSRNRCGSQSLCPLDRSRCFGCHSLDL